MTRGSIGPLNGLNLLIDTGTIPSVVDRSVARKLRPGDPRRDRFDFDRGELGCRR